MIKTWGQIERKCVNLMNKEEGVLCGEKNEY